MASQCAQGPLPAPYNPQGIFQEDWRDGRLSEYGTVDRMSEKKQPVRVAPIGDVAMASSLWRLGGQLMVTVVAKVTARFRQDGVAELCEPESVHASEQNDEAHPRSVIRANELAPMLRKADVTMTGTVEAAPGTTQMPVRVYLSRGQVAVLDKTVHVFGKRKDGQGPQPLDRMWLGWEHALGGLGFDGNPVGVGKDGGHALPNLVSASRPEDEAACFAPVSAIFPCRRKLSRLRPKQLKASIVEIPADFDWAYFQSAPIDQQVARLHGDEWLQVQGAIPNATLCTQLPRLGIQTHVYGHKEAEVPDSLPLRFDMLHIDLDAQCLLLVARGSFPVQNESRCAQMVIAATPRAVHEGPFAWPERPPGPRPLPARRRAAARPNDFKATMALAAGSPLVEVMPDFHGTMDIQPGDKRVGGATPFGQAQSQLADASKSPQRIALPGAPWHAGKSVAVPVHFADSTLAAPIASPLASMTDEEQEAIFAKEREAQAAKEAAKQVAKEAKEKAEAEAEATKNAALQEAEERRKQQAAAFEEEQRLAKEAAKAKAKKRPNLRTALYKKLKR